MEVKVAKFVGEVPNSLLHYVDGVRATCFIMVHYSLLTAIVTLSISDSNRYITHGTVEELYYEIPIFTNEAVNMFLSEAKSRILNIYTNDVDISPRTFLKKIDQELRVMCQTTEYDTVTWIKAEDWVTQIFNSPSSDYERSIATSIKDLKSYSPGYLHDLQNDVVAYNYSRSPNLVVVGLLSYLEKLAKNFQSESAIRLLKWKSYHESTLETVNIYLNPEDRTLYAGELLPSDHPSRSRLIVWTLSLCNEQEVNKRLEAIAPYAQTMIDILKSKLNGPNTFYPISLDKKYENAYKSITKILGEERVSP